MDAIAPGVRADQQQDAAGGVGGRRSQLVNGNQTHAHCVDQRVLGVGFVEADFAADIRDADAVAVPGNALDHAPEQVAVAGVGRRAEAQGVEEGNGPGAHSQDVPDDAADAGGRPLQRLYRRGVVMGFDLEHHGQPVANIYRSGVFRSGLGQDAGGTAGQQLEQRPGVFVAAMLAPQRAEHPQFHRVGFPVQPVDNQVILGGGQGDLVQDFLADRHS